MNDSVLIDKYYKQLDSEPTIFVVEDDKAIAEAIRWLLSTVGLKAELYPNAQAYLNVHDPHRRGCLLIDIRMPGMSGLELQDKLGQHNNPIPIIIITGHGDVPLAMKAIRAGALNFITKPFDDQLLIDEINKALAINDKQHIELEPGSYLSHYAQLLPRERTILEMIVEGKMNNQIAQELAISPAAVEFHRIHIMRKMQIESLPQLVRMYSKLVNQNLKP